RPRGGHVQDVQAARPRGVRPGEPRRTPTAPPVPPRTVVAMSSPPPARRLRLGLPRRVFSQVLLMQLAIAAGVAVLATGLFLAPLGDQLDDQAMRRALAIAQTTAQQRHIADGLQSTAP